MKNSPYFKQAQLMLRVMPHVGAEKCFALKGGTAINFFVRDMSRLSVDIDLTYLPLEPRGVTLVNIGEALQRVAAAIRKSVPGAIVQEGQARGAGHVSKLSVSTVDATIKIESNPVLRGAVFVAVERQLSARAEELFELSVTASTLAVGDLYGGKLCAALGLERAHYGVDLCGDALFITAGEAGRIGRSPRINIDYAGAWVHKPWRFYERGNRYVSVKPRD